MIDDRFTDKESAPKWMKSNIPRINKILGARFEEHEEMAIDLFRQLNYTKATKVMEKG